MIQPSAWRRGKVTFVALAILAIALVAYLLYQRYTTVAAIKSIDDFEWLGDVRRNPKVTKADVILHMGLPYVVRQDSRGEILIYRARDGFLETFLLYPTEVRVFCNPDGAIRGVILRSD